MLKHQYTLEDVEVLGRKTVYQGFFRMDQIKLRHRLFGGGWVGPVARELFVRRSVMAVLPYDPANRLVGLLEQFRIGALADKTSPWLFELVAGICDPGETPQQTAHRELEEEAGLTDVEIVPIHEYWVSPGGTDEMLSLFCGLTNLKGAEGVFGVEHEAEDIRLHVIALDEAFEMVEQGHCNNAATIIALQWLRLNGEKFAGIDN